MQGIDTYRDELRDVPALDFMWLELTNQCNLQCLHCYSESSPRSTVKNILDENRYAGLITEAYELGCRKIQFIGGEPTLNKSLPSLIAHANRCGYQFIEVFSNLVSLSDSLVETFLEYKVAVATSVYAHTPQLHDLVTQTQGSHDKTIRNIKRLLDFDLHVRVGVIGMEENKTTIDSTFAFLRDLGVNRIGFDRVRNFGRAQSQSTCSMEGLCGNCAGNILAVGPDGLVAPCIMSKQWSVGSVLENTLSQIALSDSLFQTRSNIATATTKKITASCAPDPCHPFCAPFHQGCGPNCSPNDNCNPCTPMAGGGCNPNQWCNPNQR